MSRKYNPTTNIAQKWQVTLNGPLDIRTVMTEVSDLINPESFGGDEVEDFRYQGMLVAIVNDSIEDNNGVYVCTSDDFSYDDSDYQCWQKLLGLPTRQAGDEDYYVLEWDSTNQRFKWTSTKIPQNLSNLSDTGIDNPSNGQYLRYNSTTEKWENSSGGGGSGSGVTTEDIYYGNLFKDPSLGGLGYVERGASGTGFGFLRKNEPWEKGNAGESTIPAGTTYQEIFARIFDGENISLTVNSPQNKTYNSSYQLFGDSNVQLSAPTGYSLYYRVGDNGAWASYDSSLLKGKDAGTYTWQIRINDDDSTIKTAVLNISKSNLTITSGSAEKVFDGTPLTRHTCTFSPNYNDHGLTVNYTGTGTLPGNYQNTFTTSGTLSSNYNSPSLSFGTLKILPFIQYSIQSNRISVTKDTSVQFPDGVQRKVSGQSDVYYINGRSGEVQGDTYTFKIYVAGNQVIDTTKLWFFNDSTKAWESSASDANAWGNINLSSPETITELGATTRVYTYSNVSGGVEVPFPNIYVAFKVKNS